MKTLFIIFFFLLAGMVYSYPPDPFYKGEESVEDSLIVEAQKIIQTIEQNEIKLREQKIFYYGYIQALLDLKKAREEDVKNPEE